MTTELLIREGAVDAMTSEDVSEMAARYLLIVAPESSAVNFPEIEGFRPSNADQGLDVVASELLRGVVNKAVKRGVDGDQIVFEVVGFTVAVVMATITEAPPQALVSVSNLFGNVLQTIDSTKK